MSGNNLETAISMFFEQSAFSNQNAQPEEDGNNNAILTHNVRPDWFNLVWPKNVQAIPESWINQKLEFSDEIKYGLVQHKNGPCGILSVIQAVLISQFIKSDAFDPIAYCATDLDLANAIYSIIKLVSNPLQKS